VNADHAAEESPVILFGFAVVVLAILARQLGHFSILPALAPPAVCREVHPITFTFAT
jgi:hypothetical protein